ncbi:MAG: hypothetical protein WAM42_11525 [Candidatus Nitrosopolaris sp.]
MISIGKLVRKNDGPEEVEQILSTMTKYGNERPLNYDFLLCLLNLILCSSSDHHYEVLQLHAN